MVAVDKVDSAGLTINEIESPTGWILLGFMMDPRTGLGHYHDYRISRLPAHAGIDRNVPRQNC